MPIAIDPGTPGEMLHRLAKKLVARQKHLKPLYDRYEGNAPLPESMQAAPEAARVFFKAARTGFAEIVVKSVKYPLNVQSIGTAAASTDVGDDVAHQRFVDSGMADEIDDVTRNTLVAGNAFGIVGEYEGEPAYTAEDPRQVVTLHDPVRQRVVLAAAKFWHDEIAKLDIAHLWWREERDGRTQVRLYRATVPRKTPSRGPLRFSPMAYDWDESVEYGGSDGVELPRTDGEVPVFRYRNEEGVSEFERHIDVLNRLDHMVLQGLVIATLQAFRQRAIMVAPEDMPDEDEDGNEIDYTDVFTADPGALWKLPSTATLWESANIDLTPVWTGMEKFTQQFSAVTFTPLAMFSPDGANQAAKGVEFMRESRTFKVEDRQRRFGAVHARALAMLFRLAGDTERSQASQIEVQWRPAERYSVAERYDALVKAKAGGVPWRTRMIEVAQFTPKQVARMDTERADDLLAEEMAATAATPTSPAASDA